MKQCTCPICKGTGKIKLPYTQTTDDVILKKMMAKVLRKEGFSVRQIMKFLGYKSPRSVARFFES